MNISDWSETQETALYIWKYRDRPNHGYHLDGDQESVRWLREIVTALLGSARRVHVFHLAKPPGYVTAGPRIGQRPKAFKRLKLQVTEEQQAASKELKLLEHKDELTLSLNSAQLQEFAQVLDEYLKGHWDFCYGNLHFWPYFQWHQQKRR